MKIETKIFGHRGYPAKFAENSLEGFEYALETVLTESNLTVT